MKAMVLAAGRGERLRPLTDRVPKPMLEAGGKPLLAWHLERLAAAGFREVVVNVAHLAERIVERFGSGGGYGVAIAWSREPEPLETAGAIAFARALLGEAPFALVNADVYAEYDYARLRRVALGEDLAHLVLVANPPHHPQGDFSLAAGRLGLAAAPRYTYAGIAVLAPRLVDGIAAGARAPLAPLLRAAAARGAASGEIHEGFWCDAGTPERLAALDARLRERSA
ncbi:MAG: nucleotidyltransferase family protein [Burkholderiales bacterium]|nr:nucleotidyltransferase family protein [Burkholderiales bacterium]